MRGPSLLETMRQLPPVTKGEPTVSTITRDKAVAQGFTIDETCNPPVAYKGARFSPVVWHVVVLPECVRTYLDLCTTHLSKESACWLEKQARMKAAPDLVVYEYKEGFFIPVPEEVRPVIPVDVLKLLKFAIKHQAILLRLDADGFTHEDLVTYDW